MTCGDPHEVDCREVLSEVYFYLDSECGDARRDLIKQHLAECSPCLAEYGIEQDVRALVHRCCSKDTAPQEVKARLREKLAKFDLGGLDRRGPAGPRVHRGMGLPVGAYSTSRTRSSSTR